MQMRKEDPLMFVKDSSPSYTPKLFFFISFCHFFCMIENLLVCVIFILFSMHTDTQKFEYLFIIGLWLESQMFLMLMWMVPTLHRKLTQNSNNKMSFIAFCLNKQRTTNYYCFYLPFSSATGVLFPFFS